jgi:hypothetical protein
LLHAQLDLLLGLFAFELGGVSAGRGLPDQSAAAEPVEDGQREVQAGAPAGV